MNLPDRIYLEEILAEEGSLDIIHNIADKTQTYREYVLYSPYLILALLFGVGCFMTGVQAVLKWFGSALLVSGAVFLSGLLALRVFIPTFINEGISETTPLLVNIFLPVLSFTISKLYTLPIIFMVIGIVMIISSVVYKKYK